MGKPIVNGSPNLTFQGNFFEYNPRSGFSLGFPYIGPFAKAAEYAQKLILQRIAFRFDQYGPLARVTIIGNTPVDSATSSNGGTQETPVDNWQLLGNEIQKDLFEHPSAQQLEVATPGTLGLIRAYVASLNTGTTPTDAKYQAITGNATAMALINLLSKGATHYAVASPVLRHTQTVSDYYVPPNGGSNPFDFATSETIYSTAQMLKECASFAYPLPALLIQAIESIPTPGATGYTWGWRKAPPSINTVANYKIEIVTEYISDLWNTAFAYSTSNAPT